MLISKHFEGPSNGRLLPMMLFISFFLPAEFQNIKADMHIAFKSNIKAIRTTYLVRTVLNKEVVSVCVMKGPERVPSVIMA